MQYDLLIIGPVIHLLLLFRPIFVCLSQIPNFLGTSNIFALFSVQPPRLLLSHFWHCCAREPSRNPLQLLIGIQKLPPLTQQSPYNAVSFDKKLDNSDPIITVLPKNLLVLKYSCCFLFYFINFTLFIYKMKRSLAPPRRDKPAGGDGIISSKKLPGKPGQDKSNIPEKSNIHSQEIDHQDRNVSQKFQERYRNKNLNILPTQMLVALSALSTLDISYNKLSDSQIELIMNSCTKLSTFCIQGNLTNLIPSSIVKLKMLVNFRHDWIKMYSLSSDDIYQPEKKLERIKQIAKKNEYLTKLNKIVGIDFTAYCQAILEVPFDQKLAEKIQKCQCSQHAKDNMMVYFQQGKKGNFKRLPSIEEEDTKEGKNKKESQSKNKRLQTSVFKRETIFAENSRENLSETASTVTKATQKSEHVEKSPLKNDSLNQEPSNYYVPGLPLHNLFANFDKNYYAPAEIDGLLLRGYNPNLVDANGLSPYHLCIIYKQKKGLEYLLEISSNNPGFFDLELASIKENRNILHYSVFSKNYQFTKMLLDFGLPIDKRDLEGYRLVHLAGKNYEFLILLRKLLRKRTNIARNLSALAIPNIPHQNKRNYVKHPTRQKEESRFRITYSRNDKLLELYENAMGVPNIKV